jgi:hypothetical protein
MLGEKSAIFESDATGVKIVCQTGGLSDGIQICNSYHLNSIYCIPLLDSFLSQGCYQFMTMAEGENLWAEPKTTKLRRIIIGRSFVELKESPFGIHEKDLAFCDPQNYNLIVLCEEGVGIEPQRCDSSVPSGCKAPLSHRDNGPPPEPI